MDTWWICKHLKNAVHVKNWSTMSSKKKPSDFDERMPVLLSKEILMYRTYCFALGHTMPAFSLFYSTFCLFSRSFPPHIMKFAYLEQNAECNGMTQKLENEAIWKNVSSRSVFTAFCKYFQFYQVCKSVKLVKLPVSIEFVISLSVETACILLDWFTLNLLLECSRIYLNRFLQLIFLFKLSICWSCLIFL